MGTILTLFTEFGEHQVRLTKWVESNNTFIHYHFEYLERHDTVSDEVEDGVDNQSEFNGLWNDL